jgi:hypothetical protein
MEVFFSCRRIINTRSDECEGVDGKCKKGKRRKKKM